MEYKGIPGWGESNYDSSWDPRSYGSRWQATNHAYSQHEQYNPVYPSLDGSSSFFSSSTQQAQNHTVAPYRSSKPAPIPRVSSQRNRGPKNRKKPEKNVPNRQFHLITVNTDPSGSTKLTENVAESAPATANKVAPASNKPVSKRGRGGHNMPNIRGLHGNGWDSNSYQNQRGGGNRGGRGRGGYRGRQLKPTNSKDDIPFVPMADEDPAITVTVSSENITAFHGLDSVFTTQHSFPVLIDNKIYKSCDHYYQIRKVIDLTGVSSNKLDHAVLDESGKPIVDISEADKDKKTFSAIAKDILKASNISKEKVDEWRYTKGLESVQKALLAKVAQSAHLREALKESHGHILVHAFPRDSIYGTGCGVLQIKKWLEDLAKAGVKSLKVPATFPLDETSIQKCPVFAHGRNVLGVILMQLREKVLNSEIEIKDTTNIYAALRVDDINLVNMDQETPSGFSIDNRKIGTF